MFALLVAAILTLGLAPAAGAATPPATTAPVAPTTPTAPAIKLTSAQKKLLWATVNICDTLKNPDTAGIAASMPVVKKANGYFMRVALQYLDASTKTYKPIGATADSGWVEVAPTVGKARTAGHSFQLAKPPEKNGITLRAEVQFEWRKGKKILGRAKRITTAAHPSTMAADPKRFSAATCVVKP